jgi:hypothetical protein
MPPESYTPAELYCAQSVLSDIDMRHQTDYPMSQGTGCSTSPDPNTAKHPTPTPPPPPPLSLGSSLPCIMRNRMFVPGIQHLLSMCIRRKPRACRVEVV